MPAARESLLDAAFRALDSRPWAGIRMVDVAASAGVSRQTLYNEFGSKEGLARALMRREADTYLAGVEEALAGGSDEAGPGERLAAVAEWTVRIASGNPLVRAALTGCWSERLPSPAHLYRSQGQPAGAAAPLPSPGELLGWVRDRAVQLLQDRWPQEGAVALSQACETATRLALSYVVAPAGSGDMASAVRGVVPSAAE